MTSLKAVHALTPDDLKKRRKESSSCAPRFG